MTSVASAVAGLRSMACGRATEARGGATIAALGIRAERLATAADPQAERAPRSLVPDPAAEGVREFPADPQAERAPRSLVADPAAEGVREFPADPAAHNDVERKAIRAEDQSDSEKREASMRRARVENHTQEHSTAAR